MTKQKNGSVKRYELQPGIGDAVYAFPLLKKLAEKEKIEVACVGHEIFSEFKNIRTVDFDGAPRQLLRFEAYRGGDAFSQMAACARIEKPDFDFVYFPLSMSATVDGIVKKTQAKNKKICVIHEPHIAARSRETADRNDACDAAEMGDWLESFRGTHEFVTVGRDDIFLGRVKVDYRTENCLSLTELFYLVASSDIVATQCGLLVTLACAFRKKLKMFQSRCDNAQAFEARKNVVLIPDTCEVM